MVITTAHITPLVALIAGILILIVPRLLNYIVAIYLILVGLIGLNAIYQFMSLTKLSHFRTVSRHQLRSMISADGDGNLDKGVSFISI